MIVFINLGGSPAKIQYKSKGKAYQRFIPQNAFVGFRNLVSLTQLDSLASLRTQGVLVYDFNTSEFAVNTKGFSVNLGGQNYDLQGNVLEFKFISDNGRYGATTSFIASSVGAGLSVLNTLVNTGGFPAAGGPGPQPPIFGNQSAMVWSTIDGEDNWFYHVLDYTNSQIIGPIDTGLATSDWSLSEFYPITEGGYMTTFYNGGESMMAVYAYDYQGTETMAVSASSVDYSSDVLDGKWFYFNDRDNKVFYYSNGEQYEEIVYSGNNNLDINWDWDAVTNNGYFSFNILNNDTGLKSVYAAGAEEDKGNIVINNRTIKEIDTNTTNSDIYLYFNGDFIAFANYSGGDEYYSLEFYNTSGTPIQTVDLSSYSATSIETSFYGDNKAMFVCYNYNDNNVPYCIVQFDGNAGSVITETHERGSNYPSSYIMSIDQYYPNNTNSENCYISLYESPSSKSNLWLVTYLDILSFYSGATGSTTYVFQDSGNPEDDKYFGYYRYGLLDDSLMMPVNAGDGNFSILNIQQSGGTIIPLALANAVPDYSYNTFGNNYQIILWSDQTFQFGTLHALSGSGEVRDSLQFSLPGGYDYMVTTTRDFSYFTDRTSGWYMNNNAPGFVETEAFNQSYEANTYYAPDFYRPSNVTLINSNNGTGRVFSSSGVSQTITLPESLNSTIDMGYSYFAYEYVTSTPNEYYFNLYDFDGYSISSSTINNTYLDFSIVKQRTYWKATSNEDSSIQLGMVTPEGFVTISYSGSIENSTVNDYLWWND